jgi:hypothetical protein
MIESQGFLRVPVTQFEAMMTMLIDSGDMTPMARLMLRKLYDVSEDNADD